MKSSPASNDVNRQNQANRRIFGELAPIALLVFLWLAAFGGYFMDGSGMAPGIPSGDARTQWACWREFGFGWAARGELPFWNPHVLCGVPFLAGWQSALLYPPNIVFAIMSLHQAARLSIALHMALAAVAAYLLARYSGIGRFGAIAAAVGYSFAAPQLLRVFAGHWGAVCAIAWSPLILLGLEAVIRRPTAGRAMLGGCAAAMQLLSGAPQYAAYAWMMAALYLGARLLFFADKKVVSAANPPDIEKRAHAAGGNPQRRAGGVNGSEPADDDGRRGVSIICRTIIMAGFMFLFGLMVAAPQALPALAAGPVSARAVGARPDWSAAFSLHPAKLVTLFAHGFFGDDAAIPYWGAFNLWEMCGYAGCVIFALAAAGIFLSKRRLRWALGLAAAVLLLLALGRHIPPVFAVYRALPGMGELRGTAKFLSGFSLLFCMLAGLGLDALMSSDARTLRRFAAGCGAGAVLLIAAGFALSGESETWRSLRYHFDMTRTEGALSGEVSPGEAAVGASRAVTRTAVFLAALCAAAAACSALPERRSAGGYRARAACLAICVLALASVDMLVFGWKYLRPERGFDVNARSLDEDTVEYLREKAVDSRVWIFGHPALNDPMRMGLRAIEGIEPNPPLRFHRLFAHAVRQPVDIPPSIYQAARLSPLWAMMGARWVAFQSQPEYEPSMLRPARGGPQPVYENEAALPRVFIVLRHRVISGYEDPEAADYSREVLLESPPGPPSPASGTAAADRAAIIEETPNRVIIQAELTYDGWLVMTDNYFPGWRAEVNGEDAPIHPANYAFRAVRLGAGEHRVVFRFRPVGFYEGLAAFALAALLGLIHIARRFLA